MRVTIVTPSYNQASYLEQTIQSVLNQTYQNFEYMIIDGDSQDGSKGIIRKYQDRLAYWRSEKDRGFADAINQGWKRATGDVFCYLNSDDLLEPDALATVVQLFGENPSVDFIYGDTTAIDENGSVLGRIPSEQFDIAKVFSTWGDPIKQPSAFFRRKIWEQYGGLDDSFQFCADFEYFVRISIDTRFLYVPLLLSRSRHHSAAKSISQQQVQSRELIRMFEKFRSTPIFLNSGVSEQEAQKGLYGVVGEHYINAGYKWSALGAHIKHTRFAYSGVERLYRILRYIGRLVFR